jgi:hypothetical protein
VRCAGGHHGLDDGQRQRLVLHQRAAGPLVAHLLGRAAHVDVDDLRAAVDVVLRRLGHHGGVGAGDLHRDRPRLAVWSARREVFSVCHKSGARSPSR